MLCVPSLFPPLHLRDAQGNEAAQVLDKCLSSCPLDDFCLVPCYSLPVDADQTVASEVKGAILGLMVRCPLLLSLAALLLFSEPTALATHPIRAWGRGNGGVAA